MEVLTYREMSFFSFFAQICETFDDYSTLSMLTKALPNFGEKNDESDFG